jgi:hypothetical protein
MPVSLVLRSVKGSALTTSEMDANLSNVKVAVEAIEDTLTNFPTTGSALNATNATNLVGAGSISSTTNAVTQAQGVSNTRVATTAFVRNEVAPLEATLSGVTGSLLLTSKFHRITHNVTTAGVTVVTLPVGTHLRIVAAGAGGGGSTGWSTGGDSPTQVTGPSGGPGGIASAFHIMTTSTLTVTIGAGGAGGGAFTGGSTGGSTTVTDGAGFSYTVPGGAGGVYFGSTGAAGNGTDYNAPPTTDIYCPPLSPRVAGVAAWGHPATGGGSPGGVGGTGEFSSGSPGSPGSVVIYVYY